MQLPAKKVGPCLKDLILIFVLMTHKSGEIIDKGSKIMHP